MAAIKELESKTLNGLYMIMNLQLFFSFQLHAWLPFSLKGVNVVFFLVLIMQVNQIKSNILYCPIGEFVLGQSATAAAEDYTVQQKNRAQGHIRKT